MLRTLIVGLVMLLALPAHSRAEEFGAWRFAVETDSMTEKRTPFIVGIGDGLKVEITCKTYESRSKDLRALDGKRYFRVGFVADSYLGYTTPPPAIIRVDENPALEVDLSSHSKNAVIVISSAAFINKLVGKQLRVRLWGMDDIKHEYTLSLEGMPAAIDHLKKECGMTPGNTYSNDWPERIRPAR